nr:MAG: 1-deoxy-D-xylulose-5-phosphate synthase [Candidatus Thorarchaeota archaeon SMTZ1-83]
MGLLDSINSPADLKKLKKNQLETLASEIRRTIIEVVSRNGGHLAPNLGVVELTVALHYVFSAPEDRVVWDVGHQSYTHKLLTGRREVFHTLRTHNGICGFPSRKESEYDTFNTGHASTSISAALGMACSRDFDRKDYRVIAVIGDGALTAGLAFEGLNQTGYLKRNIIIILNDNRMSISQNVGAVSHYLTKLITTPIYNRLKEDVWELLGKMPSSLSDRTRELAHKIDEGLKNLLIPSGLFEEIGLRYIGPIDGHDLDTLIETFQGVERLTGPVLIHVVTKKGKGYNPAETNPSKYHGLGPSLPTADAVVRKRSIKYTEVFGKSLVELAEHDSRIVAITAAMPEGTGLTYFQERFPERFFDVGIAEQHAVTFAAGLASSGYKPVCGIYSTFLQRAYDQVLHDICLQNLPVVFCLDRSGIVGEDGPTHHGNFDISYLRHLPNLVLMAPKDEREFRHMLYSAFSYETGPVAIRYPRAEGVGVEWKVKFELLDFGKAEVLREGEHASILALGSMVYPSLEAANLLSAEGIEVGVVNARFVKPLDTDLLTHLGKTTKTIITAEENALAGGFGSAVMEFFELADLGGVRTKRIGLPDRFIEHGKRSQLLKLYGLATEEIAARVRSVVEKRRRRRLS